MKKYIGYIILLIIIAVLCFILFIGKGRYNKDIEKANDYIEVLDQQIKELKSKPPVTVTDFITLTDQEQVKAYQELSDKYNTALNMLDDASDKLKDVTKQLDKCNTTLKRQDKVFISGIIGVGFDQEWNLTGQVGATVNGKVFDGAILPVKIYLGGGAVYTVRTNFQETINGGNFILQTTILIGK